MGDLAETQPPASEPLSFARARARAPLFVWPALGLVIYFLYGRSHGVAQRTEHEAHGSRRAPRTRATIDGR